MFNKAKQLYTIFIFIASFFICFESLAQVTSSLPESNAELVASIKKAKEKLSKAKFKLSLKVISCQKNKMPDYIDKDTVGHEACGDLDSIFLFNDVVDVALAKESRFNNLKPVKVLRTVPDVSLNKNKYEIKEQKIINKINLGVEVFVKPTKIADGKVTLDFAVRTRELAENEEIFLDSNHRSFINNGIGFKHRYLVAKYPLALNDTEILGGDAAVLSPRSDNLNSNDAYPETARLWLEVKLMPPSK